MRFLCAGAFLLCLWPPLWLQQLSLRLSLFFLGIGRLG